MLAYDGMPLQVAWRVVERRGVDISDLFGIVTAASASSPPARATLACCVTTRWMRGPSPATRGKYGNINHRRGPSA